MNNVTNSSLRPEWPTVVAGFGSPHGDDQAGWRVATLICQRGDVPARTIHVCEPTQLLDSLRGCERLIVVDACRSGGVGGQVRHLIWPDPRIAVTHRQSSHGVGVFDVLKLAERLGEMPGVVEIFGIEAMDCSPGSDLTSEVSQAVTEVTARIVEELREVSHA